MVSMLRAAWVRKKVSSMGSNRLHEPGSLSHRCLLVREKKQFQIFKRWCVSPLGGHGDAIGAWEVPSLAPRCFQPGKGSPDPHGLKSQGSHHPPYLAAAVGDDRVEEGIRCFLDGPQDGGDVDDGCLAATQALFFAVLGSLLQQRQEGLGRNNLVRHLCLKTVSLIATATQGG